VTSSRWLPAAGALALVLWSGPLVEAWADGESNLVHIWEDGRSPTEPTIGWERALRLAGPQFGVPAPWMGAPEIGADNLVRRGSPLPLAAAVAAGVLMAAAARRRGGARTASFIAY